MNTPKAFPPLWAHQEAALEKAKSGNNLGLFLDLGTGKTRTAIEILKWHWDNKRRSTLILCPLAVIQNWKREIIKYSDIPENNIIALHGTGRQKERSLGYVLYGKNLAREAIIITNYESLISEGLYNMLIRIPFDNLVCDESHKVKSITAKRTKNVIKLADKILNKYILTGTPVLNTPMDLFSQYKILFGGFPVKEGCKWRYIDNIIHYRNRYFYDANAYMPRQSYFPNWKLKKDAVQEINKIVAETSVYVKKQDCLTLPPFIKIQRETPIVGEHALIYKQMLADFIAFFEDGNVAKANIALVKGIRLMQIVSGFVTIETPDGEPEIKQFKNTAREAILYDLLEDLTPNHKVIVWATFKHNYAVIRRTCDALKIKYVELHGEVPAEKKQENIDAFNNNEEVRVIIANQLAGGVGVNLLGSKESPADYSIYFSRDFSLEGDMQSEARNYRAGCEHFKSCTRIDLVTPGTIDELVLKRLDAKQALGSEILSLIKGTANDFRPN